MYSLSYFLLRLYQLVHSCLCRIMCIHLKTFMAWLDLMRRVSTKYMPKDSPLFKGIKLAMEHNSDQLHHRPL